MVKYRVDYSQVPVLGIYDKHLEHYGRMKKLLEAHQTKVALTEFRKKALETQNRLNYQNEYDRIRGLTSRNLTGFEQQTVEGLRHRQNKLEKLGAQVIDNIA